MYKKIAIILATIFHTEFTIASSLRDNYLCFYDTRIISFNLKGYSVTNHQPFFDTISIINKLKDNVVYGCIYVQSGRKNSSKNVEWVKNNMLSLSIPWDEKHMVFTKSDILKPSIPKKLHFAIYGNLFIKLHNVGYICNNIQIGQGNYSGYNNWWLFSNNNGKDQIDRWSLKCEIENSNQTVLIYPNYAYKNNLFKFSFEIPETYPDDLRIPL